MRNATARRLWAWVAILGVLFGTLAPVLAHASYAESSGLTEICTVDGMRYMDASGHVLPPEDTAYLHTLQHCPLCAQNPHHWLGLLPNMDVAAASIAAASTLVPARFLAGLRPLCLWLPANPRAPPAPAA